MIVQGSSALDEESCQSNKIPVHWDTALMSPACALLMRSWPLWTLRVEGWKWTQGPPGTLPHLPGMMRLVWLRLSPHQGGTPVVTNHPPSPRAEITSPIRHHSVCFISPEKDFSPKHKNNCFSRYAIFLASTSDCWQAQISSLCC